MESMVYLKPNVVIEPLVDRWYAWSHLISPATAAMNIEGRHLKIMNSFIQAPHIHAAAVKNPKLLGGPFMDIPPEKVKEVGELKEKTLRTKKDQLDFSAAIRELDAMLKAHPRGHSLEEAYGKVPDLLKGLVELVYDLNNNPGYRFFEPLLYQTGFYDTGSQSIALWVTENDDRPFVLSTPRLDSPEVLHLEVPFDHPVIDKLGSMKRNPAPFSAIRGMIDLDPGQEERFRSLFTAEVPPAYQRYEGPNIRMRYFGHACILIETREVSILVDPLISYYGYLHEVDRFSDVDLPDRIDYVLITHNHQDPSLFETLLPLRHKIGKIIVPRTTSGALQDPNLKLMFRHIGFENVIELGDLEKVAFRDCDIMGIPFIGEHSDLNIQSKLCYHVRIGDFRILFVADSCNVENALYERIQTITGKVDVLFLGMECDGAPLTWLYGPLLTEELPRDKDGSRRLAGSNYERGMGLVEIFDPQEVYVYAMGMEPWLKFISSIQYTETSNPIIASGKLVAHCEAQGRIAERLYGEKELLYQKAAGKEKKAGMVSNS